MLVPARLPRLLRVGLFALATAVVLGLCLVPESSLPKIPLWDKIEHSLAWGTLTVIGVSLSPRRWRGIAAFALGLGVSVEVLQALIPTGRQGDWRDFAADAVGVALALVILRLKGPLDRDARKI